MTTAVAAVITGMCAACQCSFQSWVVIQTAPVRHRRQTSSPNTAQNQCSQCKY